MNFFRRRTLYTNEILLFFLLYFYNIHGSFEYCIKTIYLISDEFLNLTDFTIWSKLSYPASSLKRVSKPYTKFLIILEISLLTSRYFYILFSGLGHVPSFSTDGFIGLCRHVGKSGYTLFSAIRVFIHTLTIILT